MEKYLKVLGIIGFISIFLSLVFIRNSPVIGYELSIYDAKLPWIFLVLSNSIGTIILVSQTFPKNRENKKVFRLGFIILILTNFIILTMFAMKGYYFYNMGDSIEHYQIASSILLKGIFENNNIYPITHLMITEISEINNLSIGQSMSYLPAYLSILFMIFVYLLAGSVLQNYRQISLAVASSSVFLFSYYHVSVYPSGFSVLMIPLVFYLYFKSSEHHFRILFIILLVLYTFFHPQTSLMLISFLIILELIEILHNRKKNNIFKPVLISATLFFLWDQKSWFYKSTIHSIYLSIFGQKQENYFVADGAKALQNIHGSDLAELFVKMYGVHVIYSLLSLLAIILIIKKMIKYRDPSMLNIFNLSMLFLVGMPISYLIFVSTKSVTIGRLLGLNYIMIVTPILLGFALFEPIELIKKSFNRNLLTIIIVLIISISFISSMLSVYRSPWVLQQNWQVTYSYMSGLKWFEAFGTNISSEGFGFYQASNPAYYRYGNDIDFVIPEHFNYSYNNTFGEQINQKRYVVITEMSKLANSNHILNRTRIDSIVQWGFNEEDFHMFENEDITVDRIYSNGEFWIYLADPIK